MRIHTRASRLALSAICLGSGLLGAGGALAPNSAVAAGTLKCATSITGSGSSLQKSAQIEVFIKDFASTLCGTAPTVTYTKTSSGPALEEFGNETEALTPAKSGNGSTLDGYAGSDDPPQPAQLNKAAKAGGGGDQQELTIPVAEAPVALLLNPPASCTVTADPQIPNTVLDSLWQGKYASWDAFLTAAGVTHEGAGCGTVAPQLIVRSDNSGTSYVFKSYLAQIDSSAWSFYANDGQVWPAGSKVIPAAETGGSGEAKAVAATSGGVGYAAASDAHGVNFGPWSLAATIFWADIQNNGSEAAGATYADPASASNGNCPSAVTPAGAPSAPGSWYGVLASGPNISAATGFTAGQYSLCGLTYDLAWRNYRTIGSKGQSSLYGGTAAIAQELGDATADFLTYITGQGQTDLAGAGKYYSALPAAVQKVAQETVTEIEGANVSPTTFTAGFHVTTATPQPGASATFDATSSTVPSGDSIVNYQWDFGDGTEVVSTPTSTVQHTFAAAGNYKVTLTVTDAFGNTAQTAQTIAITTPGGGATTGGTTTGTTTTGTTTTPITTTPTTTVAPKVTASIASSHANEVAVTVSCPTGVAVCSGAVTVKTAGAITASVAKAKKGKHAKKVAPFTVGSQTFSITGGQSKTLQVTISAKAAALLRQKGTLSLIATITVSGGNTVTEHVTLHAKKTKATQKHGK